MNPHHTGFIFSTIHELKGHDYRSELLTSLMEVSPDRYIEYSPKDFFYMMARDPAPPPVGSKRLASGRGHATGAELAARSLEEMINRKEWC